MLVRYLYLYTRVLHAFYVCECFKLQGYVCVCVLAKGASDTSIMIENGGIREGPVSPRENEEMKVMQKSKAGEKTLQPLLCD